MATLIDDAPVPAPGLVSLNGHSFVRLRFFVSLLSMCFAFSASEAAVQVSYALPGPLFNDHTFSDGSSFPEGFEVQIGIFQNDFEPGPDNLADWSTHWRGLITERWLLPYGVYGAFTSDASLTNFPTSARLYALGYQQVSATQAEVFLFTDNSWQVPANNPTATPLVVQINEADTVIVGSLDPVKETIETALLASTTVPPFYFAEWLINMFELAELANPAISGFAADPDGDGIPNALEYLTGSDPKRSDPSVLALEAATGGHLRLSTPLRGSAQAIWTLQHSADLRVWTDADPGLTPNDTLSALQLLINPGTGPEFWRLRVDAVTP